MAISPFHGGVYHSVLFAMPKSKFDDFFLKSNILTEKPNEQFFLPTENFEKGLIVPYACGLPVALSMTQLNRR